MRIETDELPGRFRTAFAEFEKAQAGTRIESLAALVGMDLAYQLETRARDGDLPEEWKTAHIAAADAAVRELRRQLADAQAENSRLRQELDALTPGLVLHCMERDAETMQRDAAGEATGTVIRATDTGREWVRLGDDDGILPSGWIERPRFVIPDSEPAVWRKPPVMRDYPMTAGGPDGRGQVVNGAVVMGGGGSGPISAAVQGSSGTGFTAGGGGGGASVPIGPGRGGAGQNGDGSWATDGRGCPVCGCYGQAEHGKAAQGFEGCPNAGVRYSYDGRVTS